LSLDTVKAFLRIGHDGEDTLVADLVQAARERLERVAGLALVLQTVKVCWTEWPKGLTGRGTRLPIEPVQQLGAVRLVDADDTFTDQIDAFQIICDRLCLRPWHSLPCLPEGGQIEMELQVGFGTAEQVPDDLREALLHLIGAMYQSRAQGAHASSRIGLPSDVQAILDARKEVRL
jgi:uncharacterized phiE125 gp8 family phage protein